VQQTIAPTANSHPQPSRQTSDAGEYILVQPTADDSDLKRLLLHHLS